MRRSRGFNETIGYATWLTSHGRSMIHRFRREDGLSGVPALMLCGTKRGLILVEEHFDEPDGEEPCPRCIHRVRSEFGGYE